MTDNKTLIEEAYRHGRSDEKYSLAYAPPVFEKADTPTDDERSQASLDSERLRQLAEWLSMDMGHGEVAERLNLIADRHDHLAAEFATMTAEKEKWRVRCAEETIAWTDATRRADTAEARWRAAEDECRAVQSRLDAILAEPQVEPSDALVLARIEQFAQSEGVMFAGGPRGAWLPVDALLDILGERVR